MRKFYVYKYFDSSDNLLYVGQTIDFIKRYRDHSNDSSWFKDHVRYEVAEVKNKTLMDMYEVYMINKLSPIHNVADARNDDIPFDLPQLTFEIKDMSQHKYVKPVSNKPKKCKVTTQTPLSGDIISFFVANNYVCDKVSEHGFNITLPIGMSYNDISHIIKQFVVYGKNISISILGHITASTDKTVFKLNFDNVHIFKDKIPHTSFEEYSILENELIKGATNGSMCKM